VTQKCLALTAHARDELGISEITAARPIQAALTSAATFSVGAAMPLLMVVASPPGMLVPFVSAASYQLIQDFEANLELTYLAQVVPGWTVQPVLTYVWHPDGGASSANALVIGVRSIWHF
jgi:Carbohydrate-selective porin, OprB family